MAVTSSQPLVSLITPVYNEEQFLAECIESVLAQTYQNWDYTIVDNCSTDRSLKIAQSYAEKDPRIRIHQNKHFLNQIPNHNLAVKQISPISKYCKVVLGDDWIFPECVERMVAVGEANPSVGIVSAYQLQGVEVRSTGLPYQTTMILGREACRQFFLQKAQLFGTPTSVLYRADLVRSRNPFYVETDMSTDFEVCFALLQNSDLGFVHQVLSFSRERETSIGTITSDLGANLASLLENLIIYGSSCLTDREFRECLDRQLCHYYRFLGRRAWVEHDREFWSYHKSAFHRAGLHLSTTRLATVAVGQLLSFILNPKATTEAMRRLSLKKRIRNVQMRNAALGVSSISGSGEIN